MANQTLTSRRSRPGSSSTALPVLDNSLTRLQESFRIEVLDFRSLRGITTKEVLKKKDGEDPLLATLRKFCVLTQTTMTHMNESCPGLPPDSIQRTIDLVTQPGSKVVTLTGIIPGHKIKEPQILGYGIMMIGRDNIIDKDHIPDELKKKKNACRVIRLFVTQESRECLPRGEAFTRIIDKIKLLSGNGLLIGMILTDIKSSDGKKLDPSVWLDAKHALDARGFEYTGYSLVEPIKSKNVNINFEWWTWSKKSKATPAQEKLAKKVAQLETYKRERLAPLVPAIPLSSATIAIHGRDIHGFDVANAYPGNLIIAPSYEHGSKVETAHNLVRTNPNASGTYIENGKLKSSAIMGACPDIINLSEKSDPKEAIRDFIKAQHRQLDLEGTLVIRDTVAPKNDTLIQIRLSTTEAERWRRFIKDKAERHIPENSWNSIKEASSPVTSKEAWICPLSVAMEFMNKRAEGVRLHTVMTAEERDNMLEEEGFRISYSAPVKRPDFEKGRFENKIELFNLKGERLEYPDLMHVTIAEKVRKTDAVEIEIANDKAVTTPTFLKIRRLEKIGQDGKIAGIQEIVDRTNREGARLVTLDVLPCFVRKTAGANRLYFGARVTPRPLIALNRPNSIDETFADIYHVEQIGALFDEAALNSEQNVNNKSRGILAARANISRAEIKGFLPVTTGYSRADSYDEQLHMQVVETTHAYWKDRIDTKVYNLKTRPKMRTFEASLYLQGCQAGVFQDRRLELMVYQAGIAKNVNLGSWLNDPMPLSNRSRRMLAKSDLKFSELQRDGAKFRESTIAHPPEFFEVRETLFKEKTSDGTASGVAKLENTRPHSRSQLSNNSISILPVSQEKGEIYVGLEGGDFGAAYLNNKNSFLLSMPVLRIPDNIPSSEEAKKWAIGRLAHFCGVSTDALHDLGGKYLTSPGFTSETIQPTICEARQKESLDNKLQWVSLKELLANADKIECLQLRTAVYRAAHMYGLIGKV